MDYEKLGAFYLGRPLDLQTRQPVGEDPLLYESKDLVTHGVCFGMTGSGKTGLCAVMLEEAAIDGIPAIVIDPKGDLTNLLLTFPDLRPSDFEPWVAPSTAQQAGMTIEQYAAAQADLWRKGLAAWKQDGSRIDRLKQSADFAIYTPGSEAGIPVSVLRSFDAPPPEVRQDQELYQANIAGTVSSLLGLVGIEADPVESREHILLSLVLQKAWNEGRSLDLAALILEIQKPSVQRIGVFEVDTFYPPKDRMGLAMRLNSLLASPSFASWLGGEPLDIARMLYTSEGRPRVSIFSIAHLSDPERMFFVSLLLNHTVNWMRQQPGTTSLRALLYMDEIYGYFPPVANPAAKAPLITLLKQARAYGLGVLLATQNPMDLDYKGLANIGTWLIGRLQTDRDQARVLDGLEAASAGAGVAFDRATMSNVIAGLGKRRFLLYNVHDRIPDLFETRWALSYLAGPLTRDQIRKLSQPRKAKDAQLQTASSPAAPQPDSSVAGNNSRPALPSGVPQAFVEASLPRVGNPSLVYEPALYGAARLHVCSTKYGVDELRDAVRLTHFQEGLAPVDWSNSEQVAFDPAGLTVKPKDSAEYLPCPTQAADPKKYAQWSKDLLTYLARDGGVTLYRHPGLKLLSRPDETHREFTMRCDLTRREERDRKVEALRAKFRPKVEALNDRIHRAETQVSKERQEAQSTRIQSAISIGGSVLGAIFGRKLASASNVSRARSAMSSASRANKQASDVERAEESLQALQQSRYELEDEMREAELNLRMELESHEEALEQVAIRPKKTDISIRLLTLVWLPYWRTDKGGGLEPAWRV